MASHDQKQIESARTLGILSICLCFIPIAGIILGILSINKANPYIKKKTKAQDARRLGELGLGLSIFVFVISMVFGYSAIRAYEQQIKAQAEQVQQAQQAQEAQKFSNKLQLNTCLGQAEASYNRYLEINANKTVTDSSGKKIYYLYQPQWDYINGKEKTDKDECYRRYPTL